MKILDVLKSLGIKPEDDINTIVSLDESGTKDTKGTAETKDTEETKDEGSTEETKDTDTVDNQKILSDGWFNADTNEIDFTKIGNSEVADALKVLNTQYVNERNNRLISDELNKELANYTLNVSEDTLKKVLSMADVKIDENSKVVGVKEAIDNLKSTEPGFFKETKAEGNPLVKEGFNPVEKASTTNLNSFSEAFRVMDEIN